MVRSDPGTHSSVAVRGSGSTTRLIKSWDFNNG